MQSSPVGRVVGTQRTPSTRHELHFRTRAEATAPGSGGVTVADDPYGG